MTDILTAQREPAATRWWRRPWVAPLFLLVTVFLAFSLPRYLTFDPAQSRVPAPDGASWHYPLLVAHVLFASVAMISGSLQVWPWFRQRYPLAHKHLGRVYVFAGVLPAGVSGFIVGANSPFGPINQVSNVMLAVLWLAFTATAVHAARQRRFGDHRKWMIRSFALTMSIITNRLWGIPVGLWLEPQLATIFGGSEIALGQAISGLTAWLGWTVTLLAAEWWLQRRKKRSVGPRQAPAVAVA
ncbi:MULTISPECIES: DUF2306 domain-containing protein [unclassified Crossiella]|uniref:DUF2306 domain-containing protein n=1 Tax=unclassified Crossiella TaxID=2620835 RepID=UPI001FFEC383|nr:MULTISPECIES: DUF2306 domain-containing protein [unclassified Crossiella]MCK2245350.1 DUF2306 domain-containing protein [Crossiella sp. S99.2]MCK2258948.1 DUF2306 domain-containing protein [Crossiella sp. S99.1]